LLLVFYFRKSKTLRVLGFSLTLLSSSFALMLKLKFLFAFFLMHSAMFAWGQGSQPPTSTSPAAAKSSSTPSTNSATPSTAPKSQAPKASSKSKTDLTAAGIKNASGVICTVFAGAFEWWSLSFVLTTYTTYMIEPTCDEDYYYSLTVATITAQTLASGGSVKIFRGGSHNFTMDVNLSSVRDPYFYIGNLRFSKNGEVRIKLWEAFKKRSESIAGLIDSPYVSYSYLSQIHYIWNVGTLAHRLVSPIGETYIMFSFTDEISTGLTRDKLINLKDQLSLPPGWKFENFLVSNTITVRPGPLQAYYSSVMFDELNNFYIKYQE